MRKTFVVCCASGDILSLNPAKLAQLLPERVHEDRATRSSACIQVTYAEDFRWVLRVGGEAKSQDESGKNKANNFFIHFSLFRLPPHAFLFTWSAPPEHRLQGEESLVILPV